MLQGLADKSLDTRKFASVCTDGASVMTGEQNGLAGLLQREFTMILTFHCVCHRLALATKHTKFLFTTILLSGESSSANAPTIKAALLQGLADKSLDTRKFGLSLYRWCISDDW